jgi:putative aldouronate transport system substrate-binding protein
MSIPRMVFIMAMLLAAMSVLAGGQGEPVGAESSEASIDPATGREMVGNMFVSGLPIVAEPVTFESFVGLHPLNTDILEMEIYQRVEEMTNVRIRGEFVYPAGREERKNLLLASGDLPDLFLGRVITASDLVLYGPQGLFVELSDLVSEYAPNVERFLEMRPEYKQAITTPDGGIYSLPLINELLFRENPDVMFINKSWLDAVGLDVPETTDEYRNALRAFKNSDPNGNGVADEVPLSFIFGEGSMGLWSLFGAFGAPIPYHATGVLVGVDDGQVVFRPTGESARLGLEYLRDLYAEGLLDPEGFTQNIAQYNARGRQQPVVFGSFFDWLGDNAVGQQNMSEYVVLPPLRGPNGDQGWNRYAGMAMGTPAAFVITSANEHPEVAMRWVNELFEERLALEIARGPIGTTLRELPDGRIGFLPTPEGMGYGEFRFSNAPGEAFPGIVLSDTYDRIANLPASQARKLEFREFYVPYFPEEVFPRVMFNADQERRLAVLTTDINSFVEQRFAQWIVGDERLNDASWENYLNQLDRMGLEDLLAIYQTQID